MLCRLGISHVEESSVAGHTLSGISVSNGAGTER